MIVSSAAMGIGYGRKLKEHLEELRYLKQIYIMVYGELRYTKAPIPEIMLEISRRIKSPYANLFRSAHTAWEEQGNLNFPKWFQEEANRVIGDYRKEKKLTEEEWELFLAIGSQTGYMDLQMQLGALKNYMERWDMLIRKAENDIGPKQRIGNCLGILSGIFLSVLLL